MPRGKTNKPVKILAHKSNTCDVLAAEAAKGSTVHYYPGEHDPLETYDIILGPQVWRITDGMGKLIPVAIMSAKQTRYTKPAKRSATEDDDEDE